MRFFTLTLLCITLLLAAPLGASAKSKKDKGPEMVAKLLAKVIESAGNRVTSETELDESELMGDGNEVVKIGSLTLNITIGDVVINSNESSGGGGNELAFRLLDLMGMAHEKMGMVGGGPSQDRPMPPMPGMPPHGMDRPMGHPDVPMMGGSRGTGMGNMHGKDMPMGHPEVPMMGGSRGIGNPHGNVPKGHPDMGGMNEGHGKGHPKIVGHPKLDGQGKGHPKMQGKGKGHPNMDGFGKGHPKMEGHGKGMPKGPHGETPGFHPKVIEMMQMIPKDVDPEFFGLMMRIAEIAWERPELRERLELMVRRMEEGETGSRPHGR